MKSLNQANLIGNVGADPEVRTTQGGEKVATFSLATSVHYTAASGEKQEKTQWHRVVAWKALADIVDKYVKKGERIYVSGSIEYKQWEKDGEKRYSTEIKAREIILLGGKQDSPTASRKSDSFDDFPAALEDQPDDLPF